MVAYSTHGVLNSGPSEPSRSALDHSFGTLLCSCGIESSLNAAAPESIQCSRGLALLASFIPSSFYQPLGLIFLLGFHFLFEVSAESCRTVGGGSIVYVSPESSSAKTWKLRLGVDLRAALLSTLQKLSSEGICVPRGVDVGVVRGLGDSVLGSGGYVVDQQVDSCHAL
jgi:hypothetical protein